jgi:hypothetical protein
MDMLYGEMLYLEELYDRDPLRGSRIISIPIDFEIGMGAFINAEMVANIPDGTRVIIEFSPDNQATWTRLWPGESYYIVMDTTIPGNKTIYIRLRLETTLQNLTPEVDHLTITVEQIATAYRLAYEVFYDAGLSPEEYWIDPELLEFYIPYAWLRRGSHAAGLKQVIKFVLGNCYCTRQNIIRLEGPDYPANTNPEATLTTADYREKKPLNQKIRPANEVTVYANPLVPTAQSEEVYRNNATTSIKAGEIKELIAYFTTFYTQNPVVNCTATLEGAPAGVEINSQSYYAWGGKIIVSSTVNAQFTLVINGYPLKVKGRLTEVFSGPETSLMNRDGILYGEYLYGEKTYEHQSPTHTGTVIGYTLPSYHLIQTREMARKIAGILLNKFPEAANKLELKYRGNPALTVDDAIALAGLRQPGYKNYILKTHELIFNGTLEGRMEVK